MSALMSNQMTPKRKSEKIVSFTKSISHFHWLKDIRTTFDYLLKKTDKN